MEYFDKKEKKMYNDKNVVLQTGIYKTIERLYSKGEV